MSPATNTPPAQGEAPGTGLANLQGRLALKYGSPATPATDYPRHRDHLSVQVPMSLGELRALQGLLDAQAPPAGSTSSGAGSAAGSSSSSA